jgi:hypothetical protein
LGDHPTLGVSILVVGFSVGLYAALIVISSSRSQLCSWNAGIHRDFNTFGHICDTVPSGDQGLGEKAVTTKDHPASNAENVGAGAAGGAALGSVIGLAVGTTVLGPIAGAAGGAAIGAAIGKVISSMGSSHSSEPDTARKVP